MKLFLDTANLEEIEQGLKAGIISGITTNPALMAKEPKDDFYNHIGQIFELCKKYTQEIPISVEVFSADENGMLTQAQEFAKRFPYPNLVVKIPIGWERLRVIRELKQQNIAVNCTCGFTEAQAVLAANAGARYFSLFHGRTMDIDVDPLKVIYNTRRLLEGTNTEIIIGSVRHMKFIVDSFLAGAHIVTAPLELIKKMAPHPQSAASEQQFLNEFKHWMEH